MKILTVIGSRPQFVKAAMVSRAIKQHNHAAGTPAICEEIIHTGQHYDPEMSQIFFDQMDIPKPVHNLDAGSGLHGEMTGRMMTGVETQIIERRPDWVLLYGDTNSTLAGALAAAKLHVPIAHVEAGLRSFNRKMPEEINRVLTDHISQLLFCPTHTAIENLKKEGINQGVCKIGDVMYDAALVFSELAETKSQILETLQIQSGAYYLSTCHRPENTDYPERLKGILSALETLTADMPVVLPLHPRTRKCIAQQNLQSTCPSVKLIDPISFLDMVQLEKNAHMILTDSGGIQKEAYFHGVPCVTLRDETEWVETLQAGWNQLAGACTDIILECVSNASPGEPIDQYGDGEASQQVVNLLLGEPAVPEG
jgi:UDP-GlcNAc3NAcA epimerase